MSDNNPIIPPAGPDTRFAGSPARRKLAAVADALTRLAYDEAVEIETIQDCAINMVLDVIVEARAHTPVSEVVPHALNGEIAPGVPTGLTDVDCILGGMQKGDLLLLAGRPGMGKSSFLTTVALNAARYSQRILFFSSEASVKQQMHRWVAAETGIAVSRLRMHTFNPEEWERFGAAIERLKRLPLYIAAAALSVAQIRLICHRQGAETGLDLVIVDAMDRLTNPAQEPGAVSTGLKRLARELKVPVLAAASVRRAVEQRQDKRPALADLRDRDDLAQAADVVMFLYRDDVYNADTDKPNIAELHVAKHRTGPTGVAELFYKKELMQFTDLVRRKIDLNSSGDHDAAQTAHGL